jgi:hypothetical protein
MERTVSLFTDYVRTNDFDMDMADKLYIIHVSFPQVLQLSYCAHFILCQLYQVGMESMLKHLRLRITGDDSELVLTPANNEVDEKEKPSEEETAPEPNPQETPEENTVEEESPTQ